MTSPTERLEANRLTLPLVAVVVVLAALGAWASSSAAQDHGPVVVSALQAPPGAMAEAAITADPQNPGRLAAAANPYSGPVRIVVTLSDDGGATWSSPIHVVPPGFVKSYDPILAFDDEANLVVVGGAAGQGAPFCQPGSAIFVATISHGEADYDIIRDTRGDAAYVDRPSMVAKYSGSVRFFVTWTESRGAGAECRATPIRSSVMFARLDTAKQTLDIRGLTLSGLAAPFGATMALNPEGALNIAVGEHGAGNVSRLVFLRSNDEGATLSPPIVLDEGATVPLVIAGVGGVLAPVPSVAASGGRVSVAWNKQGPTGPTVGIYDSEAGDNWRPLASPLPGSPGLLPTLAYDAYGRLWVLLGRFDGQQIEYELFRWNGSWEPAVAIARTPTEGFSEIGQGLGLVSAAGQMITAAPVDGEDGSSLVVARLTAPSDPPTPVKGRFSPPAPSGSSPSVTALGSVPPRTQSGAPLAAATVASVLAIGCTVAFTRRRQRRRPMTL